MGKKKPAPPPAPDYAAAATAQGQANMQAGQQTASLSNPNIYGPYGNQTVSYDTTGPNGMMQPTIRQTLNPEAQAALEAQQRVERGTAELGEQGLSQARNILNTPFSYQGPGIQTSFNTGPQAQTSLGDYGQVRQSLGDYGQVQQSLGDYGSALRDLDLSGISNMPLNAGTTAQSAIMSRLDPQLKRDEEAQRARLANQGLTAGGEGYNAEQNLFDQRRNDLYTQAGAVGLNLDMAANQQGFNQRLQQGQFGNAAQQQNYLQSLGAGEFANQAQGQRYSQALGDAGFYNQAQDQRYNQALGNAGFYNQGVAQNFNQNRSAAEFGNSAVAQSLQHQLGLYNQPMNQLSALMSASQIQAPQFQQYTGANINAAPVFDATKQQGQWATDIYGQQMAGYNAGMQALGAAVGGLAGNAGLFAKSDIRLKSNIVRVGDHPLGIGIYEYDIDGHRERGVMAQEVMTVRPTAVAVHPDGYLMVDYGALN